MFAAETDDGSMAIAPFMEASDLFFRAAAAAATRAATTTAVATSEPTTMPATAPPESPTSWGAVEVERRGEVVPATTRPEGGAVGAIVGPAGVVVLAAEATVDWTVDCTRAVDVAAAVDPGFAVELFAEVVD